MKEELTFDKWWRPKEGQTNKGSQYKQTDISKDIYKRNMHLIATTVQCQKKKSQVSKTGEGGQGDMSLQRTINVKWMWKPRGATEERWCEWCGFENDTFHQLWNITQRKHRETETIFSKNLLRNEAGSVGMDTLHLRVEP